MSNKMGAVTEMAKNEVVNSITRVPFIAERRVDFFGGLKLLVLYSQRDPRRHVWLEVSSGE